MHTLKGIHGRLSMWRAFGGSQTRVAFVLKVPFSPDSGSALGISFGPVLYLTEKEVHRELREVMANVTREAVFLKSLDRQTVTSNLFAMLYAAVTCLKHEGFQEEREWRAIYTPQFNPSRLMETSVEIVNGVPQRVHKIPLDGTISPAIADLEFAKVFDRLIIGPSPYPWAIYQAFVEELERAGVKDAADRVVVSDIPIRS